jgi:hypothetical protein
VDIICCCVNRYNNHNNRHIAQEDNNMKYKCGHDSKGVIILDDNTLGVIAYLDWQNSVGINGDKSMCWECYCKRSGK